MFQCLGDDLVIRLSDGGLEAVQCLTDDMAIRCVQWRSMAFATKSSSSRRSMLIQKV